ncbi:MAG: hypothetical protein Unbinned4162contig1001_33 [Prokaryotic dsDNA virus sp.]|nr:MAG: hypothetical protein Unbinned4162contig1001_33 [Prokaryotic dsDNA virus sp.]|tara:strand:- start:7211 stop:7492 length:282 start_codon:yes stop_codon:yes gene_type:complete
MNTSTITVTHGAYEQVEFPNPDTMGYCYGTCGYRQRVSDDNYSELCCAGDNWWTLTDLESDEHTLIIHKGDVEQIKKLIAAEFKHFSVTVNFK